MFVKQMKGEAYVSNLVFVSILSSILSIAVFFAPASALAQQFTGTLRGTVQDSSGAVLPAVNVTVTEVATNDSRELTSDTQGRWVLPNLKPGTYRVSVAM